MVSHGTDSDRMQANSSPGHKRVISKLPNHRRYAFWGEHWSRRRFVFYKPRNNKVCGTTERLMALSISLVDWLVLSCGAFLCPVTKLQTKRIFDFHPDS